MCCLALAALVTLASGSAALGCRGAEPIESVRIYALDCGAIELPSLEAAASQIGIADPADNFGRMVDVCYLIRHPKGDGTSRRSASAAASCSPRSTGSPR